MVRARDADHALDKARMHLSSQADKTRQVTREWQLFKGYKKTPLVQAASESTPIDKAGLSVRARKALTRAQMHSLEQAATGCLGDLYAVKNCGPVTIREIERAITAAGLTASWNGEPPCPNAS